jgi:membrane protein
MTGFRGSIRPGRVLALYLDSRGPLLARGMAFSALFPVFAARYVLFAVAGIVFKSSLGGAADRRVGLLHAVPPAITHSG